MRSIIIGLVSLALAASLSLTQSESATASDTALHIEHVPAKFKISLSSSCDTKTVLIGDPIEGTVLEDVTINGRTLIPMNSSIIGQVLDYDTGRNVVKSVVSKKDRFRRGALLKISFDTVITPDNHRFKIEAIPAEQIAVFNNEGKFRTVEVAADGVVTKAEGLGVVEPLLLVCVPVPQRFAERHRLEIRLQPGDELTVQASIPCTDCLSVSGKVIEKKVPLGVESK